MLRFSPITKAVAKMKVVKSAAPIGMQIMGVKSAAAIANQQALVDAAFAPKAGPKKFLGLPVIAWVGVAGAAGLFLFLRRKK